MRDLGWVKDGMDEFLHSIAGLSSGFSLSELVVYSRFRRHPGFSRNEIDDINALTLSKLLSIQGFGFFRERNGKVVTLAVVEVNRWESDYFGLPMARLHCFASECAAGDEVAAVVQMALGQAFQAGGIRHVSADVDIDDYRVVNSLFRCGFEVMDIKRTYFTNRLQSGSDYERFLAAVRGYRPDDAVAVADIIGSAHFDTRFTRDVCLDSKKSEQLYRDWFGRLIADAGVSSQVVVFERNGKVVGCGGIGEMDFSVYGLSRRMRTGSLYACSSDGVGGYGPVLYCLTRDALRSHGLVETTVSLNNAAAVRVVEGVRPNRSLTSYALRYFNRQE